MPGISNIKIVTSNAHGIIFWLVTCQAVLAGPRKVGSRDPTWGPLRFFGLTLKNGPVTEVINKFRSENMTLNCK